MGELFYTCIFGSVSYYSHLSIPIEKKVKLKSFLTSFVNAQQGPFCLQIRISNLSSNFPEIREGLNTYLPFIRLVESEYQ